MEIQGGGGPPYIQVGYPAYPAYDQGGQLHDQLGQLSLQDPVFLQELQRVDQPQPQQLHQQQVLLQQQQPLQGFPVQTGYAAPGSLPGSHAPPPTSASPGNTAAKHRNHDEVTELTPEEVRWFYRKEGQEWVAFDGYDSLRVEIRYRHIWQTRWRSQNLAGGGHTRRAQSLNRYYDRSQAESYSGGSSDEYNFSDPSGYGRSGPPQR